MEFYYIDYDYIDYLQDYEKSVRGFTRVPNMRYEDDHQKKFTFGAVLQIGNFSYFAPVTSYNRQRSENICVPDPDHSGKFISSVRFNYMFPVPKECLTYFDFTKIQDKKYYRLILHEYGFLKSHSDDVNMKAKDTYQKIVDKTASYTLSVNSCDFKLLEKACEEYIVSHDKHNTPV